MREFKNRLNILNIILINFLFVLFAPWIKDSQAKSVARLHYPSHKTGSDSIRLK